jgi:formylmethanofuran:tetrahydromethanopterin formyltransferase
MKTVRKGLKVSLDTITRIPGITRIGSYNQGGRWGKHKIYLKEILKEP